MSHESEEEFEYPDTSSADEQGTDDRFHGIASSRLLEAYVKKALSEKLQIPNDPEEQSLRKGGIREVTDHLQLDIDSIAVIQNASENNQDSSYRISCSMTSLRGKIQYCRDLRIFCDIQEGASFQSIFRTLESEICDQPCDALTYLQQQFLLPKGISVIPSTGNHGQILANETLYSTKIMKASLPDPRIYPNDYLYEKAEEVQKMLAAMQKDEKVKRLHIDIDPADPWSVLVYAMSDDFVRRFRHILNETTSNVKDFPKVIGPTDRLPAKYLHKKLQDIHVAVDPALRDFLDGCTQYVLGTVQSLSEEWNEMVLRIIKLQQSTEGFANNGGLAMLHDPRECDGVTVQFHCRNPKAL